ncbi:methylated-DNA--[protein]-cysteine S-methyltransferase [Nannocystis bainbridge]|uniref:Methylated-DNA--protein-cysteine methyltransferase n=1 Tax=Nannocystis bainbridge TaxID=2995303 RepID=A0ABT5DT61_9BACT|nr:methylated-DNA--[protein]-cysteine S-methyltransferase [Nannocystis bainbridge]MDC0716834.1 methylated-DNA--[protein]-cysteine S-methyltransferase [Nannocystis bainbridge]
MTRLVQRSLSSPLGPLRLVASDLALVGIYFPDHHPTPAHAGEEAARHPVLDVAARELDEYFAGRRRGFTMVLDPRGTAFQRAVWQALADIGFGEQRTYADLARAIGNPRAVRAVGAANGRNPLSIVLPCHRVVGTGGALTGYAGGLAAKQWLLAHEAALAVIRSDGDAPHGDLLRQVST